MGLPQDVNAIDAEAVEKTLASLRKAKGIDHVTVINWIRKYGLHRPKDIPSAKATKIELDELFHFIQEKKTHLPLAGGMSSQKAHPFFFSRRSIQRNGRSSVPPLPHPLS